MARVLVVDADRDFRESAQLLLGAAGHEVYARAGLRLALTLIESLPGPWRVVVDGEVMALDAGTAARLERRGAQVLTIEKPIAPAQLIASVEGGVVAAPADTGDSGRLH
jgi:CheY-like chemotaxis protein